MISFYNFSYIFRCLRVMSILQNRPYEKSLIIGPLTFFEIFLFCHIFRAKKVLYKRNFKLKVKRKLKHRERISSKTMKISWNLLWNFKREPLLGRCGCGLNTKLFPGDATYNHVRQNSLSFRRRPFSVMSHSVQNTITISV